MFMLCRPYWRCTCQNFQCACLYIQRQTSRQQVSTFYNLYVSIVQCSHTYTREGTLSRFSQKKTSTGAPHIPGPALKMSFWYGEAISQRLELEGNSFIFMITNMRCNWVDKGWEKKAKTKPNRISQMWIVSTGWCNIRIAARLQKCLCTIVLYPILIEEVNFYRHWHCPLLGSRIALYNSFYP